jgi:hypothetical protein
VLSAQGPKGSRVILGTISTETKPPTVKEEHAVLDGKILPSFEKNPQLLFHRMRWCSSMFFDSRFDTLFLLRLRWRGDRLRAERSFVSVA